jgi:hypothetical protein
MCVHRGGQQSPGRRSLTGGVALGAGDWRHGVETRRMRLTDGATWGAGGRGWPSAWRGEEDRQRGGGGSRLTARRGEQAEEAERRQGRGRRLTDVTTGEGGPVARRGVGRMWGGGGRSVVRHTPQATGAVEWMAADEVTSEYAKASGRC